jgi:hypothetical protein
MNSAGLSHLRWWRAACGVAALVIALPLGVGAMQEAERWRSLPTRGLTTEGWVADTLQRRQAEPDRIYFGYEVGSTERFGYVGRDQLTEAHASRIPVRYLEEYPTIALPDARPELAEARAREGLRWALVLACASVAVCLVLSLVLHSAIRKAEGHQRATGEAWPVKKAVEVTGMASFGIAALGAAVAIAGYWLNGPISSVALTAGLIPLAVILAGALLQRTVSSVKEELADRDRLFGRVMMAGVLWWVFRIVFLR